MTPIAALTSLVAIAFSTAAIITSPERVFPFARYFFSLIASPPVKPVFDRTPSSFSPRLIAARIVSKFDRIRCQTSFRLLPDS